MVRIRHTSTEGPIEEGDWLADHEVTDLGLEDVDGLTGALDAIGTIQADVASLTAAANANAANIAAINTALAALQATVSGLQMSVADNAARLDALEAPTSLPTIDLSVLSIAENAQPGSTVGVLSVENGSGSYTFSVTADPDAKFEVDGSNLNTRAALDFESDQSHSVTVEADNGSDPVVSRTFPIAVTNVLEAPSLSALTIAGSVARGTTVAVGGLTPGSDIAGTMPTGWTLDETARTITIASNAPLGDQNWSLTETLADSPNSPRTTNGSSTVEAAGAALPAYTTSPSTDAFGETARAGFRVASDAISERVWGLDQGVTESGDGVVALASNPDTSNPRDQLFGCSATTGHAFHAELFRHAEFGDLRDSATFGDTTITDLYWQAEYCFVAGEAKFFATYADGSQATEIFYAGIVDNGDGTFRFVLQDNISSASHSYNTMGKVRFGRTAAGDFALEHLNGSTWTQELSFSGPTTAITSIRWGCFSPTKASDFRFSQTAHSDTSFAEIDRDFYCAIRTGIADIDQTSAAAVLFIPDGLFTGQTQARVRFAVGSDPSGGSTPGWVQLTERAESVLGLPITGVSPNTRFSYRFEVGDLDGNVLWISRTYSFKTLQTIGLPAAGAFNFTSCYAQPPLGHPYRDEQYTLGQMDDNYLGTFHLGDLIYEGNPLTENSSYLADEPPVTTAQFQRAYRDFYTDLDIVRMLEAGPYIHQPDDHEVLNQVELSDKNSSESANSHPGEQAGNDYPNGTTMATLWDNGGAVFKAWSTSHWINSPPDDSGEPALYRVKHHGRIKFIQLDTRFTREVRFENPGRVISAQQLAWYQGEITNVDAADTDLVIDIAQSGLTDFTAKTAEDWETIAPDQFNTFSDFTTNNLPSGVKWAFFYGDNHMGYFFHDTLTTTAIPTTPDNFIGELTASGAAIGYREGGSSAVAAALWALDPADFPTAAVNGDARMLRASGVLAEFSADARTITLKASTDGVGSTHTALNPPTLQELGGSFTLTEGAAQGTAAGTLTNTTPGSTLTLTEDAGGRVQISGNVIEAGATATVFDDAVPANNLIAFSGEETLAGATNSPRPFSGTLNVADGSVGFTFTNSDAEAFVAAMTEQPNAMRQQRIDDLFEALVAAGVYAKTDAFGILALGTEQAARLWANNPAVSLSGAATFTADRGLAGNEANPVDTGFALDGGTHFVEGDASLLAYINAEGATNGIIMGKPTAGPVVLNPRTTGGDLSGGLGQFATGPVADRLGYSSVSRFPSGDLAARRNGASVGTRTGTTGANTFAENLLLFDHNGVNPSSDRVAIWWVGGGLLSAEEDALRAAATTFLDAIGAS